MTTSEFLSRVRGRVEAGWCQGSFKRNVGGRDEYCLSGACSQEHTNSPGSFGVYSDSWHLLVRACNDAGYRDILNFNDAVGRTKEEVLALIDGVIAGVTEAP